MCKYRYHHRFTSSFSHEIKVRATIYLALSVEHFLTKCTAQPAQETDKQPEHISSHLSQAPARKSSFGKLKYLGAARIMPYHAYPGTFSHVVSKTV